MLYLNVFYRIDFVLFCFLILHKDEIQLWLLKFNGKGGEKGLLPVKLIVFGHAELSLDSSKAIMYHIPIFFSSITTAKTESEESTIAKISKEHIVIDRLHLSS